ncbi:hypothetical protein FB45DRAFT_1116051 [Roridomyces roridus]|uniref:Uncharacterized protein n=1 Tax=Roridomyces roridus TaxID=1738132 RepID=A0AAD7FYD9_9AGAR|nr:hypothetical protein FB45DRAFT_1116051 [Roridomyces roridus]
MYMGRETSVNGAVGGGKSRPVSMAWWFVKRDGFRTSHSDRRAAWDSRVEREGARPQKPQRVAQGADRRRALECAMDTIQSKKSGEARRSMKTVGCDELEHGSTAAKTIRLTSASSKEKGRGHGLFIDFGVPLEGGVQIDFVLSRVHPEQLTKRAGNVEPRRDVHLIDLDPGGKVQVEVWEFRNGRRTLGNFASAPKPSPDR